MKCLQTIGFAVVFSIAIAGTPRAQQPSPPAPAVPSQVSSLKITVVLSRYQGEKKLSSLPYTFSVNSDHSRAEMRMGSQIPVTVQVQGTLTTTFKDVGTSINCVAHWMGADGFKLELSVSDSSVYDDPDKAGTSSNARGGAATNGLPGLQPLRSFSSSNTLILKDGQSSQFTSAADRITGEVTKVDVTLTVVKPGI